MRGNKTPYPILIKFWNVEGIQDVITYANLDDDRLRALLLLGRIAVLRT